MDHSTTRALGEFETLRVTAAEGVLTIILDRVHRKNAISLKMWSELHRLLLAVGRDASQRVVVVTGSGDAFCSGADLDFDGEVPEARQHWVRRMEAVNDVCLALYGLPQPTIARVNGVAAGAGVNLALVCDLVVAVDSARFSQIFVKRGLSVDFGGSWILPRLVGLHRAKELAFFGGMVSASDAVDMGLINRAVPAADLDAFVDDWARTLAVGPPVALASSKRLLNRGMESTLDEALASEALSQAVNFSTRDTIEAITAFIEKRDPTFLGY